MRYPSCISSEQAVEILSGPRQIPSGITQEIGRRLFAGEPLVHPNTFNEVVESYLEQKYEPRIEEAEKRTARLTIELGRTSLYMAWMLAGDIKIPRPRRLGEHNQSVANVYNYTINPELSESRDKVLRVFTAMFQDSGKSYAVAFEGNSKNQKLYNLQVIRNILPYTEALTKDQKKVIELLEINDMIGTAIRKYHDKNMPLEEVVREGKAQVQTLKQGLPDLYKDRAEHYIDAAFRADAGAHTQHPAARYLDMATGQSTPDVTDEDRKVRNAHGLPMTLDRLFSEAPGDKGKLRFHRPKDLTVLGYLLPSIYGDQR